MKRFNEIKTQLEETGLNEIKTQLQNGELTHINISYNPDLKLLSIVGHKDSYSDLRVLYEGEIDLDTYTSILVSVINDPAIITPNTEKVAHVDVEFGAFR